MSFPEEIPPFSAWKMVSDTIPTPQKMEFSEATIQKLCTITKTKEFSATFMCPKDMSMSYEEHNALADKYRSFTTWLLGRYFHLLTCEKLPKTDDEMLIDAQLHILKQLCKSQLHIYKEMVAEHGRALHKICQFVKGGDDSFMLEVFVPQMHPDLKDKINLSPESIKITTTNVDIVLLRIIKLFQRIVEQNCTLSCIRLCVADNLNDFLFLLSDRCIDIKLEVLLLYVEIVKKLDQERNCINSNLFSTINLFNSYVEQLVLHIYHKRIILDGAVFIKLELVLIEILRHAKHDDDGLNEIVRLLISSNFSRSFFSDGFWVAFSSLSISLPKCNQIMCLTNVDDFLHNGPFLNSTKRQIVEDINSFKQLADRVDNVKIHHKEVSELGSNIVEIVRQFTTELNCSDGCQLQTCLNLYNVLGKMFMEVSIQTGPGINFNDDDLYFMVIAKINKHFSDNCPKEIANEALYEFFAYNPFTFGLTNLTNLEIFWRLLLKTASGSQGNFANVSRQQKDQINTLVSKLSQLDFNKDVLFDFLNRFLAGVSCGFAEIDNYVMDYVESSYMKICRKNIPQDEAFHCLAIKYLPDILTLFRDTNAMVSGILTPAFVSNNTDVLIRAFQIVPDILCMSSSDFVKYTSFEESKTLTSTILCKKCAPTTTLENGYARNVPKINLDSAINEHLFLKNIIKWFTKSDPEIKLEILKALPACSNHIDKFHCVPVTAIWMQACTDKNVVVRTEFAEVVAKVIEYGQDNVALSSQTKEEISNAIFAALLTQTKRSLQYSDFELQKTLIYTVDSIIRLKAPKMISEIVKILIYLIMTPTSKYSPIVVNKFFKLAKMHKTTVNQLYKQHRLEICEHVVHLCAVNQALCNYTLLTSLGKISVTLGFYSVKDFVVRECQHLLPFFLSKLVRMDKVNKLIEEIASLAELDLRELLASNYGNIFLRVFFQENKDDFKKCMVYLEKATSLSGPALRKRNFRVILNELLLNFHVERDKVLLALTLLAREDSENGNSGNIQDYLQSQFLGLLHHFDLKLMSKVTGKKDQILLSLADLFQFMGPKHVGPLRFKIIAMLRTVDCRDLPELSCEVWGTFVRSCEPDSLGPQLATIFVSLTPLLETCPTKVNDIFKYLVVTNEAATGEFIKDLFMIDDSKIDRSVNQVIQKHAREFVKLPLKSKIVNLLKYLNHETLELRLMSLKHLKVLMEKNREELDKMILGYNGIDPAVVELIEVLTLGCREKDDVLRLACGEVLGELGAVEPSHIPRRCAQNCRPFTLFIDDDAFIVGALNELTKALQGEKNTHNMDRFALAIQETLKVYHISSDPGSRRNYLWTQFPESQQQLMMPLISSRYIIKQPVEKNLPVPIYGTPVGASFHSWIYNWTCSLISTLAQDQQNLLNACLPAMKQEHKVLMYFLPHILLHSLINQNGEENRTKARTEIDVVLNFSNDRKALNQDALNTRTFALPNVTAMLESITPETIKQAECTKVVFIVLDFLNRWIREWQWQKGMRGINEKNYVVIKNFLDNFCKLQLAKCNYQCAEYPRALMYLEDYMAENSDTSSEQLSFLAKIYAELDEPDGVAGAMAIQQTEPSVEQRILALQVAGKLSDAVLCYERMGHPLKLQHIQGLFQCYLDLDNVNTALHFAQGVLRQRPEFHDVLFEMQAEPLWRLGQYRDLDDLVNEPEIAASSSWGVQLGKALIAFKKGDRESFGSVLDGLKLQQVNCLGAASLEEGAYQHGYCYISKLHALNELQQVEKAAYDMLLKPNDDNFVEHVVKDLAKEWELRHKIVQESVRIVEPLLCLRRVALEQAKGLLQNRVPHAVPFLNSLLGECWLLSAVTARASGVYQQAYTYTIKAEEFVPPNLFIEKAKLHWLREEHEQALTTLQRGIEKIMPVFSKEAAAALPLTQKKLCAEAKLLIATYNDSISNVDTDINMLNYKESMETYREWEKSLVRLGQFFDRIFQNYTPEERDTKGSDMQIRMINYFGKSLLYGTSYVYQSMPRLLSIWFDYGTRLLDVVSKSLRDERKDNLLKMTKLIDSFLERLPAYVFLTAFSQLVSRICHPQREVRIELKSIIIKLLLQYPQQSLWMIISVIKSGYSIRANRCAEILGDPQLKTPVMSRLIKDFTMLAEKLIELCNKEVPSDLTSTTVSSLLRSLPRLLNKSDFSEIMIPTHKFRKLVLPNPDFSSSQHNPFPNHYVHIMGIEEEVTIIPSLQHPRKITLRGSDGKGYIQMLKPKDDLRKDFRLMEFNDVVNQLLTQEAEARQRRLNIRLYSVAPLNEECGLIEWIPNLVGLRPILMSLYKQRGLGMKAKQLKEASCNIRDPLAKKREVFLKQLLPKHPPILGEWFRRTFPDAQSWFIARTAYIRTTAVISMVGYVLGLGDRHGENISFDSMCGDTVHVDFNCLFNKGETFEWPERVPFRLTQNMVAAMGPLGVEGVFRKSCACTLKVLRTNANTLMSIVTPFVYDPLVSWPRNAAGSSAGSNNAERTNEQAVDHIKNIELRLKGIVKTRSLSLSIPLSVDGQTNNLINEAINIDNLCQMYIGWGPYL